MQIADNRLHLLVKHCCQGLLLPRIRLVLYSIVSFALKKSHISSIQERKQSHFSVRFCRTWRQFQGNFLPVFNDSMKVRLQDVKLWCKSIVYIKGGCGAKPNVFPQLLQLALNPIIWELASHCLFNPNRPRVWLLCPYQWAKKCSAA